MKRYYELMMMLVMIKMKNDILNNKNHAIKQWKA